ncbi:NF-kappa-B inhibitor zeta-like [Pipra filicauda]|uniref:NF-kappa-B inhibitor zeta-like n=1 Tax=Pipra filicauda TaxID=649802 RepID=A0A7R5KWQ2_9PASS|nr:NF-kappa-B inhibitor zeta-like [Pipra filicauda]
MSAPADSELSSDPPQKRYMGVRVKMPVRELLRNIRLSKGLDPAHSKETSSMKMVTKGSSGKTEKRRAHPYTEKQLRQSKQSVGQTLKGLEDLDILVEVLQEDLNKSQLKEESLCPVPAGFGQGFSPDPPSSRWEPAGSKERQHSSTRLHPGCCFKDFHPAPRGVAENSFHGDQKNVQVPSSPGTSSRMREKESSWWIQGAHAGSLEEFPRNSSQNTPAHFNPSEVLLGAHTGSADAEVGHLKSAPVSFSQQDLSAISFFQFQLHREESLLRNIPADKLLAPDENGNRLLHKAVAQGRRALTYALAQRFASLNKIDEKDAEKRTALHLAAEKNQHLMVSDLISLGANVNEQDSCGKTPLHLCAQNGYLRVLEVLKHCKNNGVCVEVDLPDHYGLTPLHCAALAHTALVTESQKTPADTDMGRFLRLRQDQILEGIQCLLQMGGKAELQSQLCCSLQAPNPCPSPTTCLKPEENTELVALLRAHRAQGQPSLQEL